jgi:PAS domain S-box-containing protein
VDVPTTSGRDRETADAPADLVHAVVNLMPDAAVVVDGRGVIVAANSLADALFGYGPDELAGKPVEVLVPGRLRREHALHRDSYTSDPTQRPMGAGLDLWGLRADGTEFPVDISLAPLGVPEKPQTLAAVRDLTERRSEWETRARLSTIVSSSDDAIMSMSLNGTLTSWNPGAEHLLGYRAEEVIGHPVWRIVPADRRGELEELLARVRIGIRVPPADTTRVHRDGSVVDVSLRISLVRDPQGQPIGFAALMRDIGDRKRADDELRRLLVFSQRRERWLEAISEIRLALLAVTTLDDSLALIVRRAAELADADGVTVSVPADDPEQVVVRAGVGELAEPFVGQPFALDRSLVGHVLRAGRSIVSADAAADEGQWSEAAGVQAIGPLVCVPLTTSTGLAGVLAVARARGREEFAPADVQLLEHFAGQAGLAIDLARVRADMEQLAVLADRERIARDLHDHVIQRLFAVGMGLQAAANSIAEAGVRQRIAEAVDELDATIREVRSAIFSLELRASAKVEASTRSRILDVVSHAAKSLGFQPRLQFDGPLDTTVPDRLVPDLLAVLREALSNAARHAEATIVEVRLEARDDLVVTVSDNGIGIGVPTRTSGLANLRARAEAHGGAMTVGSNGARGTRLEWRVPLGD